MKKRLEKEKLLGLLQTKQNMAESVSNIWYIFAKSDDIECLSLKIDFYIKLGTCHYSLHYIE